MWNWNSHLNAEMNINKNIVDNFKKSAKISGTIFILLGITGVAFPAIMTLATVLFVGYLMLFAGFSSAYMTWQSNPKEWAGWLKSFILTTSALFIIFYPLEGAYALGLLLSFYFLMDAFASFGLAFSLRPHKMWLVWFFNAISSLAVGGIFIIGWPFSSQYMVGILVGISLMFDGFALLSGGIFFDQINKK